MDARIFKKGRVEREGRRKTKEREGKVRKVTNNGKKNYVDKKNEGKEK